MADHYRVVLHVPCRQCALMVFRAACDAHGYRVSCGAVLRRDQDGKEWTFAAVGGYTSIPEGFDRPCEKHRPKLEVRNG